MSDGLERYDELGPKVERALALAREVQEALDDPQRYEWGAYPWEHLGDAERDVRVLLAGLFAADELLAGSVPMEMA